MNIFSILHLSGTNPYQMEQICLLLWVARRLSTQFGSSGAPAVLGPPSAMQIWSVSMSAALFIQWKRKTLRTLAAASTAPTPAVHVLKLIKVYFPYAKGTRKCQLKAKDKSLAL